MEKKNFHFEIKELEDAGRIIGYGSTFEGSPDSYGDVIAPGAYAASLTEHRRNGTKPKMLYQHDARQPVGIWNDVVEDGKGLRVEGQLNLDKVLGQEVYSDLKMGVLDGLSIGFETLQAEAHPKKPGVRRLTEIRLWEVSIVTFPANQSAFITDVKSAGDAEKWIRFADWCKRVADGDDWRPSEFDDLLRDAEVAKKLRTQIASRVHRALRSESEAIEAQAKAAEADLREQRLRAVRDLKDSLRLT